MTFVPVATERERERERAVVRVTGSLTSGAHPGGLNGQDAYTGQLIVESLGRPASPDTPRA